MQRTHVPSVPMRSHFTNTSSPPHHADWTDLCVKAEGVAGAVHGVAREVPPLLLNVINHAIRLCVWLGRYGIESVPPLLLDVIDHAIRLQGGGGKAGGRGAVHQVSPLVIRLSTRGTAGNYCCSNVSNHAICLQGVGGAWQQVSMLQPHHCSHRRREG